jgi:uncharacterized protein
MDNLRLVRPNLYRVAVDRHDMLFHIPTSSLFELDELSGALLDLFDGHDTVSRASIQQRFNARFRPAELSETIDDLKALEILCDEATTARLNLPPLSVRNFPLTTLVLNVNTGCNLSCTYCYKEDLASPSDGLKMSYETAVESIEMLLRESPGRNKYNIVFFGGEPLTHMPLIRKVVAYCESRFAELAATPDFTLTTNATLLSDQLIDWFNQHRFGLTVSMDGPRGLHDRNRLTVGGHGTYDIVSEKVKRLLAAGMSRPVGCRVTLTHGITDVPAIFDHLYHDLGFHEVGFGPVTSGDIEAFNLRPEELLQVFSGMKQLGQRYLQEALENRNLGFGNMHQLMTDLHEGNKKQLPCGAGVALLAVDTEGGLNLCHRFTGSALPRFGTVKTGIDKPRLARFVEQRLDRSDTGCETCRIRNLCSGGCYHESYAKTGDPALPTYHYCDLMRDWVDFGVQVYSRLMLENPGFFENYVLPRRSF